MIITYNNANFINGEQLYTFRPNTITYGIPVDHPIGKAAGRAKIGVVFHTHYTGTDLPTMQARAGARVNGSTNALVIKNDTPMNRVGFSKQEMQKFAAEQLGRRKRDDYTDGTVRIPIPSPSP